MGVKFGGWGRRRSAAAPKTRLAINQNRGFSEVLISPPDWFQP
jgi:hypothetical protein